MASASHRITLDVTGALPVSSVVWTFVAAALRFSGSDPGRIAKT